MRRKVVLGFLLAVCCLTGSARAQSPEYGGQGGPPKLIPNSGTVNNRNAWGETSKSTGITQSSPSSAVYNNRIVAGWNDYETDTAYHSVANWAYSADKGKSFTDALEGLPVYTGKVSDAPNVLFITKTVGNPTVAVTPDGRFFYAALAQATISSPTATPVTTFNYSAIAVYASNDLGSSFMLENVMTASNSHTTFDNEAITVNPVNGCVSVTYTQINTSNVPYSIMAWTNINSASTTGLTVVATSEFPIKRLGGGSPAYDRAGTLFVAYESWIVSNSALNGDYAQIMLAESNIATHKYVVAGPLHGVALSDATKFCGANAIKGNIRLLEYPSLAIDNRTSAGNLYVAYNDTTFNVINSVPYSYVDVYLTKSLNPNGSAWAAPVVASTRAAKGDISDKFMPAVAVNKLGKVGVLYYDRKNRPNIATNDNSNWWITPYFKRFNSSLKSTGIDQLGKPFPTVVNNDVCPKCYMGDYNSVSVNGAPAVVDNNFYVFWGDNSFGDPDIMFKKVAP